MQSYLDMLAYKRPNGSASERKFINRFLRPLSVQEDAAGNLIKRIGTAPVLWSSHTDTVHRDSGKQHVILCEDGYVRAVGSDCLGADDASGMWIMIEMIKAGVEGLYIFHRGEECGGHGSSHIASKTPEVLSGIKYAIAFDRQDYGDVITEQWGGISCSNEFARSLAAQLDSEYSPCPHGVFTDTANYTEIIPECTNISVGYSGQHRPHEKQHMAFLVALKDRMLELDLSKLVCVRDPATADRYDPYEDSRWQPGPSGDWRESFEDLMMKYANKDEDENGLSYRRNSSKTSHQRLLEAIADHPDVVADMLDEYGINSDDIIQAAYGNSYRRLG